MNCNTNSAIASLICLIVSISIAAETSALADESENSSPVVIIHGAWGGSHHWTPVAERFREVHGRRVFRASLTGLGPRAHLLSKSISLQTHVDDVVNLIEFEDLNSVILVAHSYGGAVASVVLDAIPNRISQVIYLDAHLLDNGEAYLTHHPEKQAKLVEEANKGGEGWFIPVYWQNNVRDTPHPLRTLTEPLELKNAEYPNVEFAYWLFADGGQAEEDERFQYFQRAGQRGYSTRTWDWNHNPHRDRPVELTDALAEVLVQ